MDLVPKEDVLQISLTLWNFLGEHPHRTPWKIMIFRLCNIIFMLTVIVFIFANVKQVHGAMYIKTVESAITIIHTLIKYLLFSYYKDDIAGLIDDRLKFWNFEDFNKDLRKNASRIFDFTKNIQKTIIVVFIINVEMYMLKPMIESNRFVFQTWTISENIVLETIVLFLHYYFLIIVIPIVAGFDGIYFSFCAHLIVQLRLLKYKMKGLRMEIVAEELNGCIRHHQLILSIFNRMKYIYAWMLLFHYVVTLTTACSQLYVILLRQSGMLDTMATIVYIFNLFVEFSCYTFPVEEVVFEFRDLSDAIYMSNWYDADASFKQTLLVIMTKAQNQKYFVGGGLFEINIGAFVSVARKAFSFYAILKNIL